MSAATITRRSFAALAASSLGMGALRPAMAGPSRFQPETDVWTGSVLLSREGQSFVLGDLTQPIVVLKLWANWCPVCAAELPQLQTMAATLGRSAEVILVSHPQWWSADQASARRQELPFRLATFAPSNPASIVQQALLNDAGLYSVPRSLVFRERDRAIVLRRDSAADWASAPMLNQVKALIG